MGGCGWGNESKQKQRKGDQNSDVPPTRACTPLFTPFFRWVLVEVNGRNFCHSCTAHSALLDSVTKTSRININPLPCRRSRMHKLHHCSITLDQYIFPLTPPPAVDICNTVVQRKDIPQGDTPPFVLDPLHISSYYHCLRNHRHYFPKLYWVLYPAQDFHLAGAQRGIRKMANSNRGGGILMHFTLN